MQASNEVGGALKVMLKVFKKNHCELQAQTGISRQQWGQVIRGKQKITVDMAIRLAKVFPVEGLTSQDIVKIWLERQFRSDLYNAAKLDGPEYRDIKPFL